MINFHIRKYFKVWLRLAAMATGAYLSNRIDSLAYFIGKVVRFLFFILLIIAIFCHTDNLAGYNNYQVLFFFLTFNLIDVLAQALFRGIYLFRDNVRKGDFDYVISKPINPLFYSLSRLTDILDFVFLAPILAMLVMVVPKIGVAISLGNVILYLFMLCLSLLIVLGVHILTACLTIMYTESENFIWFYRESMTIGRFPPEIFTPIIQVFFTVFVPVILVVAYPAQALLGLLTAANVLFAGGYAFAFSAFCLYYWNISLKKYTSASS